MTLAELNKQRGIIPHEPMPNLEDVIDHLIRDHGFTHDDLAFVPDHETARDVHNEVHEEPPMHDAFGGCPVGADDCGGCYGLY